MADAVFAGGSGLLHVAPLLLLALLLALRRFPGEQRLAALAGGRAPAAARARVRVARPRSFVRVMARGGRLVASAMAKRPPPRAARMTAT